MTPDAHRRNVATLHGFVRKGAADAKECRGLLDRVDEATLDGANRTYSGSRSTFDGCTGAACSKDKCVAEFQSARRPLVRPSDVENVAVRRRITARVADNRGRRRNKELGELTYVRGPVRRSNDGDGVLAHRLVRYLGFDGVVRTRPMMSAAARSRSSMTWLYTRSVKEGSE